MKSSDQRLMIRIACNLDAVPGDDPLQKLDHARRLGYSGVEISAESLASLKTASWAEDSELKLACVFSRAHWSGQPHTDAESARQLLKDIEAAAAYGCSQVRVLDGAGVIRGSPLSASVKMAQWFRPLADHAASRGVSLAITNHANFPTATAMWSLLEQIHHRAVGCCLDMATAMIWGDPVDVAVTTLNTRIQVVRIPCAKRVNGRLEPAKLSHSDVPWRRVVHRLLGIGYQGWLIVHALPGPEVVEYLSDALTVVSTELSPPAAPKSPAKKPEAGVKERSAEVALPRISLP